MIFNKHSALEGQHAFLSASKYHWINYSDDKLAEAYTKHIATQRGTELHAFAAECIRLRQKLPRSRKTLNLYVNDAIGYHMVPEQVLFYSDNCFGTADSIVFSRDLLRIHDLKTGITPAHMEQLLVYSALFCLEYDVSPFSIGFELRLYQCDDYTVCNPSGNEIDDVMRKIVHFDSIVNDLKKDFVV